MTQEERDCYELNKYIIDLFKVDYVPSKIKKQINSYIAEYGYSFSGMRRALIYFYEIKGNSIEKSGGGIGILPYIYDEAREYYYNLWMIRQSNSEKSIEVYKPVVKEVTIPPPKRERLKKGFFSFLDRGGI